MKAKAAILILLFHSFISITKAQTDISKSFNAVKDTTSSPERFHALYDISIHYYRAGMSDSMLYYSQSLINNAQYLRNDSFLIVSCRILGNCYYLKNDHVMAIEYYFKGIKLAEGKPEMSVQLPQLYNNIGFNYNKLGYYDKALKYLNIAETVAAANKNKLSLAYIYENLSETYLGKQNPDSSLIFLQLAEKANLKPIDNYIQASILLDYGVTYAQIFYRDFSPKYSALADSYFKIAIKFSDSTKDTKHLANSTNEYASFFLKSGKLDSAEYYALKSLTTSINFKYVDNIIKNADLLRKVYENKRDTAEAYKYLILKNHKNDSLLIVNEENQLLALTFNAEFHEKELEAKLKEEAEQRHRYIEFSLIAIILITLVILFLLLSRSFIVNAKFITFFGEIGLLVVFEFINLVLHPFIEKLTNHATILMLIILVLIAAALIPIHHKLEQYVRMQLVEKNRRIRESTAKKILRESKKKRNN